MDVLSACPRERAPHALIDGSGRVIDHLRLSVTDDCNLSCRYCVGEESHPTQVTPQKPPNPPARRRCHTCSGIGSRHHIEAGFAIEVVRWLSERHGIRRVRLTGGEPLRHPELHTLVGRLAGLSTLEEVTLTTNGQALPAQARGLREAGLARVNVSLDTLDAARFAWMTRGGDVGRTLRGIKAAIEAGFTPVRINVLVQRGFNEDELPDLATWGLARGCVVRFMEVMPIGPMAESADRHLVPAAEMLERLSERFALHPIARRAGQPAVDYAASGRGLDGVIGIIASTTRPFCSSCRRIRITAQGRLLTCLFSRHGPYLSRAWNGRSLDEHRADAMLQAEVAAKTAGGRRRQLRPMMRIGG